MNKNTPTKNHGAPIGFSCSERYQFVDEVDALQSSQRFHIEIDGSRHDSPRAKSRNDIIIQKFRNIRNHDAVSFSDVKLASPLRDNNKYCKY